MPRPDPDQLDIAELRRRDIEAFRKRNGTALEDDWLFGPGPDHHIKVDLLGAIISGTVLVVFLVGVFAIARFVIGLFL